MEYVINPLPEEYRIKLKNESLKVYLLPIFLPLVIALIWVAVILNLELLPAYIQNFAILILFILTLIVIYLIRQPLRLSIIQHIESSILISNNELIVETWRSQANNLNKKDRYPLQALEIKEFNIVPFGYESTIFGSTGSDVTLRDSKHKKSHVVFIVATKESLNKQIAEAVKTFPILKSENS